MANVRFGLFVPQGWKLDLTEIADPVEQYAAMTRAAQVADEGGWDSVWLYDHFHTVPTPELATTFECWTATATLARDTRHVKLGQMVSCNGYRNPALYAKIASTVDVASNGRLLAGLGAGWYEHEWRAYGYPWEEVPERMAAFRDAVKIVHAMWTEPYATVAGRRHGVHGAINEPKGAVPGRKIPLWLGGGGERITLRLVAEYGDGCNVGGGDPAVCAHKLDVLRRHCDAVGRDFDAIDRSTSIEPLVLLEPGQDPERATRPLRGDTGFEEFSRRAWIGTPEQVLERLRSLLTTGINYVIVYLPGIAYDPTTVRRFAQEVISLVER